MKVLTSYSRRHDTAIRSLVDDLKKALFGCPTRTASFVGPAVGFVDAELSGVALGLARCCNCPGVLFAAHHPAASFTTRLLPASVT